MRGLTWTTGRPRASVTVTVCARAVAVVSIPLALLVSSCRKAERVPLPSAAPPASAAHAVAERSAAASPATYVGRSRCGACHGAELALWSTSDHARSMAKATDASVEGRFDGATHRHGATAATFQRRGDEFVVRIDGPDGKLADFTVTYTFGWFPLQQYLVGFSDGRYQALPVAWDARPKEQGGQRWFHLYDGAKVTAGDVLHWTGPGQNSNFMCAGCHSTGLVRGSKGAGGGFDTRFAEIEVSCEACHGPGSAHVTWAESARALAPDASFPSKGLEAPMAGGDPSAWRFTEGKATAVRVSPTSAAPQLDVCAHCHARRAELVDGWKAGQAFDDTHRTSLLDDGLYFADGQIDGEVFEHGSFVQSKMFRRGVVCSNCHEPHSGKLRLAGNGVCGQCHESSVFDVRAHTMHETGAPGSACVDCHMPVRTYMTVDPRRDHSLRIPRPLESAAVGAPNACTTRCHAGRKPSWAAEALKTHFRGPTSSGASTEARKPHFGAALDAGRRYGAGAAAKLVALAADDDAPVIARATAVELLARYPSSEALVVAERAARSTEPLLRRASVELLGALDPRRARPLLAPLLADPRRAVRAAAAFAATAWPATAADGGLDPKEVERALGEYLETQALTAERAEPHVNVASVLARQGRLADAEKELRTAQALEPRFAPAAVNLADVLRASGREPDAEAVLREALRTDPESPEVLLALALSRVRSGHRRDAIPLLQRAARLAPSDPYPSYLGALVLRDEGDAPGAVRALERLVARFPSYLDALDALVAFARAEGDETSARRWEQRRAEVFTTHEGAAATAPVAR